MDIFSRLRDMRDTIDNHTHKTVDNHGIDILAAIAQLSKKIDKMTKYIMAFESNQVVNIHKTHSVGPTTVFEDDGLITLDDDDDQSYIPDVEIGKSKGRVKDNKPVIISSDMINSLNSMDNIGK